MFLPALWAPPTSWWVQAVAAGQVTLWAPAVLPRKTLYSRAYITTANGVLLLSLPLHKNRSIQPADAVTLADSTDYWRQLERTFQTAYGRSPYHEHYAPSLWPVMRKAPTLLALNEALIRAIIQRLKLPIELLPAHIGPLPEGTEMPLELLRNYAPEGVTPPRYLPAFEPFVPNLSILDALFCAGPELISLLKSKIR